MGNIHFALDQLDGAIHAIGEKIAPALRQEPATIGKVNTGPSAVSSSLAITLQEFAKRILDAQAKISDLKNRIEL